MESFRGAKYMDIRYIKDNEFINCMQNKVVPELSKVKVTGYHNAADGTKIYYEKYINPAEKDVVVISHGFCEFTEKYEEVIYYFFCKGYSVYILDHRGHGNSDRKIEDLSKVHVLSFDEYVSDFAEFVNDIVKRDRVNKKLVLYAHSMGGAIGALLLEEYPDLFDCAILSSPMLKMRYKGMPDFMIGLLKVYAKLFPVGEKYAPGQKAFDGKKDDDFGCCTSEVRYGYLFRKREDNEKYRMNGATYGWSVSAINAIKKIQKNVSKIKVPVLLFQAGNDQVVDNIGQNKFAKKNKNVILIKIPNAKHEIYNSDYNIIKWYYDVMWRFLGNISNKRFLGDKQEEK